MSFDAASIIPGGLFRNLVDQVDMPLKGIIKLYIDEVQHLSTKRIQMHF